MSISFDRAAPYYDETRSLPDDAMVRLVELIAGRLRGYRPTLEIGVGTGRYGVPLRRAGLRMVGVDISAAMLARLRSKDRAFPAARADATRLPFPDRSFGSALSVHVLHLIPAWRAAVAELARVLGPGGIYLHQHGGDNPIEKHFYVEAGRPGRRHPGLNEESELDAEMAELGAVRLARLKLEYVHTVHVGEYIDRLAAGAFSRTWDLDAQTLRRAGEATRAWAAGLVGDVDRPLQVDRTITIQPYRMHG